MDGQEGNAAATTEIRHDAGDRRFSTIVEGQKAFIEIGGRGIAGQLVRAALEFARGQGLKVRPECSYADAWMRKHPDYDTLRTA